MVKITRRETCSPIFLPDFLAFVLGPGVRKLFSLECRIVENGLKAAK